jgi:hypothetical protein
MPMVRSFPGPTAVTTTTDGRKDLAGLVYRNTAGTPRVGLFPRTTATVFCAKRADMKLDVLAFEGVAVQYGGAVFIANDGTDQVTIQPAPVSNSRIDVIYAKQNESAAPGTDADNTAFLGVVTGTASASPVKPAIPTGAVELATLLVPAGAVNTNSAGVVLTGTHQWTTTTGGLLWTRDATERAALVNVVAGQHALQVSDRTEWVFDGTNWATTGPQRTVIVPTGMGAGWSIGTATTPRIVMVGTLVTIEVQMTKSGTAAAGDIIFTLPVGWRPQALLRNAIGMSTNGSGAGIIGLFIYNTGEVRIQILGNAAASNCWVQVTYDIAA